MSEAAITHFFTQYQDYLALALVSLAALRIGAILGRRFVRKDRPRWYPHLPPLPATPANPLSRLLDVAAYVAMAVLVVGLISNALEGSASVLDGPISEGTAVLVLWLLAFGWFGYCWATGDHLDAVHKHRYATDPAYRAAYEWRRAKELQEQEEWFERMQRRRAKIAQEAGWAAAGIEPYASEYGYSRHR